MNKTRAFQSFVCVAVLVAVLFVGLWQIKPALAVQLNSCDSTTNWSGGTGTTVSLDTSVKFEGSGSIKVERTSGWDLNAIFDPAGTWNWSGVTDISFRAISSNSMALDLQVFSDWSNWRYIDLGNSPTNWQKITALFSSLTGGAGTLNLASVDFIRFVYTVENNNYTLNIDDLQVDSTYIYAWNFNDGTRGNLTWSGTGSISNGTGWCSVQTSGTGEGSCRLDYNFAEMGYVNASITIKLNALPATDYASVTVLRVTSQNLGAGSTHLFYVNLQYNPISGIRYRTYLLGAASTNNASGLAVGDIIYISCIVSQSTALTYVNGTLAGNATGGTVPLTFDRISTGYCWSEVASQNLTLYDVSVYGVGQALVTIQGRVSIGGVATQNAHVWAGLTSNTTDSNGNYTLNVYSGIYDVGAVYNDSYEIASLVVNASASVTGKDFALNPYSDRIEPFTVRSMCIFPYWFAYNSSGMDTCLSEMNARFNDTVNTIDFRTYFEANGANNVTYTYGQGEDENSLERLADGISKAHADGKNVTLGIISGYQLNTALFSKIAPTNYTEWWLNYNEYLKWIGAWAESEGVERIIYGWEFGIGINPDFEDGTFNTQHSSAITALRTAFSGEVGYEFNWIESVPELADLLTNSFISNLDFVAISHFHPLSLSNFDTIDNLINAWFDNPYNSVNYTDVLTQLYQTYGKPILIDIGYPSILGGIIHPWTWSTSGTSDYDTHAMAFEALFRALKNVTGIMGVDLEHFDKISGSAETGQSFRNQSWVEHSILLGLLAGTESGIVTLTMSNPQNTTYTTSTVPVQLSASGGTIDTILWNCTYANGTVVYANTVYTVPTSMALGNGTYIFNARANNTDGEWDEETVMFTVEILYIYLDGGSWWGDWWGYP